MLQTSVFALLAVRVAGHGYVSKPLSKNAFAHQVRNNFPAGMPQLFRWQPHSGNAGGNRGPPYASGPGSCGANEADYARGLDLWQQWYDGTGTPVPELVPGSDMEVDVILTADHGGQAWFMIACGTEISEEVNWTLLERSTDDRQSHFMPSSPAAFAWGMDEFGANGGYGTFSAKYHVPASFSCPSDVAVGRWLWKNANQCNDANNVARKTETFVMAEYTDVVRAYDPSGRTLGVCGSAVEIFISCFDFKLSSASPTPAQPSPSSTTQAPTAAPPTQAPTQAPTAAPPTQAPTQAPPAPPAPAPTGPGLCCYGACGGGNCQGGWCGESQGNCEGNCNGEFCASAAALASSSSSRLRSSLKTVTKHQGDVQLEA